MEFEFAKEQKAFRNKVRQFIKRELPSELRWRNYYFDFYSHYDEVGNFTREMSLCCTLRIVAPPHHRVLGQRNLLTIHGSLCKI